MPLDALLDLPTKEKPATAILDPVIDDDFELDIRVMAFSSEKLPMMSHPSITCDTCLCTLHTCGGSTCYSTCSVPWIGC